MVGDEFSGEPLWGKGEFADLVVSQPGIRLQGSAESEMRSEGVIDEGNAAGNGVISNPFGGSDAANAAAADLDVANVAEIGLGGCARIRSSITSGRDAGHSRLAANWSI
jgi:hypothetical protein